ncbi:WD40 repeat-like protein [Dacryopinax primogenitus]|uniref:WD40 repeat-like protein n=1 Tax=Dacryopinax primogenitus (strain DJM 731) TaxID=1858805 RepID=M5G1A5_DACPD|nr:WD40 repeat-like protein [Dacryopinax primogenitus]EJT97547.1 WD40 repeat-like protein [Dacryopinax primogenitus]
MMNLELLSPLAQEYPDKITHFLDSSASVAQFSPNGQLLAAGRDDGTVEVWDLHTYRVMRRLEGHVKGVVSVSWSRNSRYLLTSSRDFTCAVWDLAVPSRTGCKRDTVWFESPLTGAVFHPRTSHVILATVTTNECVLVDLRKSRLAGRWYLYDAEEEYSRSTGVTTARFTPDGQYVWAGTAAGGLMIFDVASKQLILSCSLETKAAMRLLEVDPTGRYFGAIFTDRTVRVCSVTLPDFSHPPASTPPAPDSPAPIQPNGHTPSITLTSAASPIPAISPLPAEGEEDEPGVAIEHTYSDQIGRSAWTGLSWSPDGECLLAGSADKGSHKLFIWYRSGRGGLAKVLEDRGVGVEDVAWHPYLPLIASVSNNGRINLWSALRKENWSAFAPAFEELEENIDYEEREDEFDIEDEDEIRRRKRAIEEMDVDIGGTPPPPRRAKIRVDRQHLAPMPFHEGVGVNGVDTVDAEDEGIDVDGGIEESESEDDPDFFPPVELED